ncbi:zinc finger protein 16 [Corythoichthys intestinalis]|uniref:zinc finger protein 16 n=1 Tax=Corythoichthys intestinalis TaxID=161448 RepID=UPI0025A66D1F|nr:zinc finger protein 16 [Corythoichthys intestinalis]
MGSKISFSRKRSDQFTVSELTTVTSHPCSPFHATTDCKEVLRGTDCNEEDKGSKWGEEMNVTNLCKPMSASDLSESQNSEGPADTTCKPNGTSQFEIDAKAEVAAASVCYLTSENHGLPVAGQKKSGRSRKIKPSKIEDKMYTLSDELLIDQHKGINTIMQVPANIQNAEAVPYNVKSLLNELPRNETPENCTVPDHKQGEGVPLVSRRKRARPKRRDIAVIENDVSETPFPNGFFSPTAKKLMCQEGGPSSAPEQDSGSVVTPKEVEVSLPPKSSTTDEAIETSNLQIDQQIPAKVFKHDDVSQVSGDTHLRDETEIDQLQVSDREHLQTSQQKENGQLCPGPTECDTNQQVDRDGEHLQVNLGGSRGDLSLHSVERGMTKIGIKVCLSPQATELEQEQPEEAEGALAQISKQAVQETLGNNFDFNKYPKMQSVGDESLRQPESPSNCDYSKNACSPLTREPSDGDIAVSLEEPRKTPEDSSAVKVENIEPPLDYLDSNQSAKIRADGQYRQQNTLRRKRGHKRRRRITALLHQAKGETQPNVDSCETNAIVDKNIIYIRKGSKVFLQCGICSRTYKFMSQYVVHQRVHTGERPFECPECKRGFSKKSNLNLHLKTHVKNSLNKECPYCKIKFSDDTYDSHMMTHSKGFKDFSLNKVDSPVETPPRPLTPDKSESKVCQYCGKSFRFQSALVRHERVHTGEKPYKCGICGKAFGQSYFLRVHELTHWSVKRYNCISCKKSFSHYSNAKNHTCRPLASSSEIQHRSPAEKHLLTYTCHICKNVLDSLPKFNKHMRDHTGAKLYRCLFCDKLFGVRSEFNAHCSQCQGEKNGSCAAVKEEDRMSVVKYTVSSKRISTEQKSDFPPTDYNGETSKSLQSRINYKKLVKPFQPTVPPTHLLSHFVSKLNKLDNRSDPRSYLCPSCGRLFRHVGRLRAHMLTHPPHQSYTCSCCGKTLQNWTKLWRHQRVHRQRQGRFSCSLCGKRFRFVESYKKHMSEHPDFHWIQSKPKTVFLPYNCDHCTSRFKSLDLLFSHQVCHFSAQITRLDSVSDQSSECCSAQSNRLLNSTENYPPATRCPGPENDTFLGCQNQDLQTKDNPILTLNSSDQKQDLSLDEIGQSHRSNGFMREASPHCHRKDGNVIRKQKANSTTAPKYTFPSKEIAQGLICAMCGKEYTTVSDLYHHYVRHAQGQMK